MFLEAADPVELDQRVEHRIDLERIDADRFGDLVGLQPAPPVVAGRDELADDDEREVEVGAGRIGPAREALADERRIGGDDGAEQDDDPG